MWPRVQVEVYGATIDWDLDPPELIEGDLVELTIPGRSIRHADGQFAWRSIILSEDVWLWMYREHRSGQGVGVVRAYLYLGPGAAKEVVVGLATIGSSDAVSRALRYLGEEVAAFRAEDASDPLTLFHGRPPLDITGELVIARDEFFPYSVRSLRAIIPTDDEIDRDRRDREPFVRARRLDDYPRNPRYEADRGRGDSRDQWERDGRYERSDRHGYRDDRYESSGRHGYRGSRYERGDRDWEQQEGSRGRFERGGEAREQRDETRGWYNRGDRRDESQGRYDSGDRRNDSRGRYEQGGFGGDRRNDSRSRNERGGYGVSSEPYPKSPDPNEARKPMSRGADDGASTPRNSCVYCRGEDHIKRDCPDLKQAIEEGLVVLDDRKYVKWADDLGDVSMFPSMKENVEARRIKTSRGMDPVRSQNIKITFEGDMATTPIRVAATKSARGSTSKKTDTDYVMAEKDGQRIDGEEVILSPRKRGVKKFLMKKSLDEIDTVEPLKRALRQPMQCSILEYLAASKPARDELQMITRKTRIPLSEEGQGALKVEVSTVAVTGVTARADRMATVLLDGMEGVPPDKFYILGSGAVETIINNGAVLDAVIDNGSEAVIIDEDLAVQVGLGLDRSYLFEIETTDGRKQQITGVCHKTAIEVQGVRVTLPVFAVKNCSSDLLLGRTWLSHVHAVTIERPDRSQTLSIKKPDGTRVMIETVEPRDPRNRAALAVGARPDDQIKSLPISGRAVRFREKKYGPLLTEEEGRMVEVEDLGSRLIVNGNSYPKEKEEEFGGVVSVSFLRARPPMGGSPSDTRE
ncbi:hypothetical protein CBR_g49768 [Chara braunii]|uniref:CCHC-type domain-containing protein n=1 Tax=Chara braunii TaxID=69332 RepID=A0A388M5R3_CHABU|nr:hypothetical protein CBR_g49768 [Chara braunii]|eukprot:GBG89918.1 hypothetical protein CBR_g49768 [Chara braunii]